MKEEEWENEKPISFPNKALIGYDLNNSLFKQVCVR
jgi:hypothetical protein